MGRFAPALVAERLIPCAPYKPMVAITPRVLDKFQDFPVRRPAVMIRTYMKKLGKLGRAARCLLFSCL